MAAPTFCLYIVLALAAISVQGSLGSNFDCEHLSPESCSYAVSSKGKRCVLEKKLIGNELTCRTSEIVADKLKDWIETDECVKACGVERKSLGISSDSLLERSFANTLCSDECYNNCPNIVDLYFNLAAGEGMFLPKFCASRKSSGRRELLITANPLSISDSLKATPPSNNNAPKPTASASGTSKLMKTNDGSTQTQTRAQAPTQPPM